MVFMRPLLLIFPLLLAACAMQRAVDSEEAQKRMVGMTKEQVFTCMGIPNRKATEGGTEIWQYKSGNEHTNKVKSSASTSLGDAISGSLTFGDEVRDKRFCTVHVVMTDGLVRAIHYNGPTGGFLTEDEQCAFAVRNCLK